MTLDEIEENYYFDVKIVDDKPEVKMIKKSIWYKEKEIEENKKR
jgi:hypothetical protein